MIPKAVIFDMDGLMFDTERLGLDAWQYIGAQMNINIAEDLVLRLIGLNWESAKKLLSHEFHEIDFSQAHTLFSEYLHDSIESRGLPIKTGLFELLSFLDELKIKKAVATSSLYEEAMFYMKKAGIENRFDTIVTGDMVTFGKPNPDIFLHAAKLLSVPPEDCIVLEDSINGIKAASAANMLPIMIPDLILPNEEIESLLHAKLDSLSDVIPLIKDCII